MEVARATRAAWLALKPEKQADADPRKPKYARLVSDGGMDRKPYQDLAGKLLRMEEEQTAIRARGTVAHVNAGA